MCLQPPAFVELNVQIQSAEAKHNGSDKQLEKCQKSEIVDEA
jgi:hypothetical protein